MIIRVATDKDLDQICDLSNEINQLHYEKMPSEFKLPDSRLRDAPHWKSYLDDPKSVVYVAQTNTGIVGVVCAKYILNTTIPFLVHKKKCHIGTIVVSKKSVRAGVGRALMKQVEDFAKENECEAIHLEVMEFNEAAQEFYHALGYECFSRKMGKDIQ